MITKEILEQMPRIAKVEQMGDPVVLFRITTESGYYIHQTTWEDNEDTVNMYKTVTGIYPNEDINTIIVVSEAELPDNADIC